MKPSTALTRILVPLARHAMANGLHYGAFCSLVKAAYRTAGTQHFSLDDKPMTASRLSLLTGIRRGDLSEPLPDAEPEPRADPLSRLIATWRADYPDQLTAPETDALVRSVSKDKHPRTLLDEAVRLNLIEQTEDGFRRLADSLVAPKDVERMTRYMSANLGDHADAIVTNIAASPDPGPFMEQAAHYSDLTPEDAEALSALAREAFGTALDQINTEALRRQKARRGAMRVRFGVFEFAKEET